MSKRTSSRTITLPDRGARCAGFGRGKHRVSFVYVIGGAGYCAGCYVALMAQHNAAVQGIAGQRVEAREAA